MFKKIKLFFKICSTPIAITLELQKNHYLGEAVAEITQKINFGH